MWGGSEEEWARRRERAREVRESERWSSECSVRVSRLRYTRAMASQEGDPESEAPLTHSSVFTKRPLQSNRRGTGAPSSRSSAKYSLVVLGVHFGCAPTVFPIFSPLSLFGFYPAPPMRVRSPLHHEHTLCLGKRRLSGVPQETSRLSGSQIMPKQLLPCNCNCSRTSKKCQHATRHDRRIVASTDQSR